ncbi:retrovirus-related Pol polyprotein from transposon 412 [Trichonephila clavata]|uniref:Retrovirus-related Pol polyprotein from transposon 412 n=1 Tax=Trichonephila clavata TaxID=2740835 RepID=A0A8X6I2P0_TRICU|nr:retrovirus-related Pol polyprotein from transposon 412 [Trichonephila clavata]
MRVIELKQIIIGSKHYEDEFVKNLLESIMTERIENEDLEKQTLAREIQLEKEAREREFQILQQNKEIEKQQLELECLRAKQNTVVTKSVGVKSEGSLLDPYTLEGRVNGFRMSILRDTGATVDVICQKYVGRDRMKGEHVWVRHLLDDHMTCLPVAEVDIECDLGKVTSKAAVIGNHLDQGRYILGNQTAALLQGIKENCSSHVGKVNTVVTRSQTRQGKEKEILRESDQNAEQTELNLEEITDNSENEEILPPVDHCSPINPVTQIKSSTFIAEQRKSKELAPIIEIVEKGKQTDYGIKNGILIKKKINKEIVENNKLKERLDEEQIMKLGKVLVKFSTIFSNIPGKTNLVEHNIDLISDKRVQHKPYRMTNRQNEILKAEIERMLKYKIIEPGPSEYTSPMILVETPGRDPRPCIDYRKLNEMTRTEFYPIPNIEERVETVAAAKFITLIDLTKGYWQIPLSPKAQKIAAFATSFGVYRPFACRSGLKTLLIISAK